MTISTICLSCKKEFEKHIPSLRLIKRKKDSTPLRTITLHEGVEYVPDICSGKCFARLLKAPRKNKGDTIDVNISFRGETKLLKNLLKIKNSSFWDSLQLPYKTNKYDLRCFVNTDYLRDSKYFLRKFPFKSSYEKQFASWLSLKKIKFLYEPYYFAWQYDSENSEKRVLYMPDFFIESQNIFIELKGRSDYSTWLKFKGFQQIFPSNVYLIDGKYLKHLIDS